MIQYISSGDMYMEVTITKLFKKISEKDLFAVSLVVPLLPKHARSLGASASTVGFVGSIYGALQLIASPVIGGWSDKAGRRHVLLFCLVLSAGGYFILGLAETIVILALSRIPTGLFKHSQDLVRTHLSDCVTKETRTQVLGRFNAISSVGFVIGPILGGHIAAYSGGFNLCALICASIFLVNYILVRTCIPSDHVTSREPADQCTKATDWNPLSFLSAFRTTGWLHLWDLFLVRFLMGFAVLVYRSNFSMWLDYRFEASSTTVGYLTSYSGVVSTLTSFCLGSIVSLFHNNSARVLLAACSVQLAVIFGLTLAPSLWVVIVLMAPLSVANALARVASIELTIERGGEGHDKGALLGLGTSVLSLARMTSPAVGGIAQDAHVSGPTIVGSLFGLVGVSVMIASPRFRQSLKCKDKEKQS